MSRKSWLDTPRSEKAARERPGAPELPTPGTMFPPPPRAPRRPRCRTCLATDVPLERGVCADRAACEERQPPLVDVEA
jgi:hypothetical protein